MYLLKIRYFWEASCFLLFYLQHIENLGRKSPCLSLLYLSTFVHRLDSTQLYCSTYYDKTPTLITLTLIFSHKQFHKHLPYTLHSRVLATTNHDSTITPLPAKPPPRCSSGDFREGSSASYVSSEEWHRRARSPARRPHLRPREALVAAGDPPPDDEAPSKRDDREELRTCAGGNVAGEHRQRFDQGGRRDLREGEEKAFGEGDRSAPFRASLLAVQLGKFEGR